MTGFRRLRLVLVVPFVLMWVLNLQVNTGTVFAAEPSNDNPAAPVLIGQLPYNTSQDNTEAVATNADPQTTCAGGPTVGYNNPLFYQWTATFSGELTVDTIGSQPAGTQADMSLMQDAFTVGQGGVLTEVTDNSSNPVACDNSTNNGNLNGSLDTKATFPVTKGTTYDLLFGAAGTSPAGTVAINILPRDLEYTTNAAVVTATEGQAMRNKLIGSFTDTDREACSKYSISVNWGDGTVENNLPCSGLQGTATATSSINGTIQDCNAPCALITNPGSGYTSAPAITFEDSSGFQQATGTTTISAGQVTGYQCVNGCSGWEFSPAQVIIANPSPGPGTTATATAVIQGPVNAITLLNGGSGYTGAPTVTLTPADNNGSGATASATVSNGVVTAISVGNPGSGYDMPPIVTITNPTGNPPPAHDISVICATSAEETDCKIYGSHTFAEESNGQANGVYPLAVTVTDSDGTTASSSVSTDTNVLDAPLTTAANSNFSASPGALVFNQYLGSFQDADPSCGNNNTGSPGSDYSVSVNWGDGTSSTLGHQVTGVTITNGGSGYTSAPNVTFSAPPSGTTATGTASVGGGMVTGVTITDPGDGYTTPPTVTFDPPASGTTATGAPTLSAPLTGVGAVSITNGGSGYSAPPNVTFGPPVSGTTATGTANINGAGVVTGVTVTNPGTGYSSPPTVTLDPPGAGTTATATADLAAQLGYPSSKVPGNCVFDVAGSHAYPPGAQYTATVTITDDGGSTTFWLDQINAGGALTVNATQATVGGTENAAITKQLLATITDPDNDTCTNLSITVSWGDGSSSTPSCSQPASDASVTCSQTNTTTLCSVYGTHKYAEEGSYSIHVSLTDTDGTSAATSPNASVSIADAPLTNVSPNPPNHNPVFSGVINVPLGNQYLGTFQDANPDCGSDSQTGSNGSDYQVSVNWGDGTAASVSQHVVTGVTITNGGSGYSGSETVTFGAPPSGTSATGTLNVNGSGVVTGVTITNNGSGYTSAPTVTIDPPSNQGTQATGLADLSAPVTSVTGVTLTNPGSGYSGSENVTFSGPQVAGGTTATGHITAVSGSGAITGITIDNPGYGYTTPPTVTIDPPSNPGTQAGGAANLALEVIPSTTVSGSCLFDVYGTHTYSANGSFTPQVTVTDEGGSTVFWLDTVHIAHLTIQASPTTITGAEGTGTSKQLLATIFDTDSDPCGSFTLNVTWGDGGSEQNIACTAGTSDVSVTCQPYNSETECFVYGTHDYVEEGPYAVSVSVTDSDGTSAATGSPALVSIADASLTHLGNAPSQTATEGTPKIFFLGTFHDANPACPATGPANDYTLSPPTSGSAPFFTNSAYIDWGDGTASGTSGYVLNVTVTNPGSGYTAGTATATFDPPPATTGATPGTVTINGNGSVASAAVSSPGLGYTTPPVVTFAPPGGSGTTAIGVATIDNTGAVTAINIVSGGSGYASAPTFTLGAPPQGVQATGTPVVDSTGAITGVVITNPGSGYLTAPNVTFSAGGATGTANLGSVQVVSSTHQTGACNFDVYASHMYASGALGGNTIHATITDNPNTVEFFDTATVQDAGFNPTGTNISLGTAQVEGQQFYSTGGTPTIVGYFQDSDPLCSADTFTGSVNWGDGSANDSIAGPATTGPDPGGYIAGPATVNNNVCTYTVYGGHTFTEEKSSYLITITIVSAGGSTTTINSTATPVADAPLSAVPQGVSLTATEGQAMPGGTAATASATVSGGQVTIVLENGGNGYSLAPFVAITGGGGSGATATAAVTNGVVTSITVTNAGSGYSSPPTITLVPAVFLGTFNDTAFTSATNQSCDIKDYVASINWGDAAGADGHGSPTTTSVSWTPTSAGLIVPDFTGGTGPNPGTCNFDVYGAYTYLGESPAGSPYTVTVAVTDLGGNQTTTLTDTSTVADAALNGSGVNMSFSTAEGQTTGKQLLGAFTDSNPSCTADDSSGGSFTPDYTVSIDWGDGSALDASSGAVAIHAGCQFYVYGTHTYSEDSSSWEAAHSGSNYAITVTVTDNKQTAVLTATPNVADAALSSKAAASVIDNTTSNPPVEGVAFTANLGSFSDAAGSGNCDQTDYSVTVNWGDSSSSSLTSTPAVTLSGGPCGFTVTGTHTYTVPSKGGYTVTTTVTDAGGQTTTFIINTAVNDAPIAPAANGNNVSFGNPCSSTSGQNCVVEGTPTTGYLGTFNDPDVGCAVSKYTATIAWGDGAISNPVNSINNGIITDFTGAGGPDPGTCNFDVVGGHTYTTEGVFTINITIKDTDGSFTTLTATANSQESDPPLQPVQQNQTFTGLEGAPVNNVYLAQFHDTDPNCAVKDYSATINWDKTGTTATATANVLAGQVQNPLTITNGGSGYLSTPTVVFVGGGGANAVASAVLTNGSVSAINVTNLGFGYSSPPTVQIIGGGPSTSTVSYYTHNIVDTGFDQCDFNISGSHTYPTEGKYQISMIVQDAGGSILTMSGASQIVDAPLTAQPLLRAFSVTEGVKDSQRALGTVTDQDPNCAASNISVNIDWGDGSAPDLSTGSVAPSSTPCVFNVLGSHTFTEDSTRTDQALVTVTDEGGSSVPIVDSLNINDAPIAMALPAVTSTEVEGVPFTQLLVGTFHDATGASSCDINDYTATINWGDPTVNQGNNTSTETGSNGGIISTNVATGLATLGSGQVGSVAVLNGGSGYTAPPTVTFSAPGAGTTATGTATISNGVVTGVTITNPGTGYSTPPTVSFIGGGPGACNFDVLGGYNYGEEGVYGVKVKVGDVGGSVMPFTQLDTITVNDAPLTIQPNNFSAVVGAPAGTAAAPQLIATFTDSDPGCLLADYSLSAIDWGDLTGPDTTTGKIKQISGCTFGVYGVHTYSSAGSYDVTLSVKDKVTGPVLAGSTPPVSLPVALTAINPAVAGVQGAALSAVTNNSALTGTEGHSTGSKVLAVFTDANPTCGPVSDPSTSAYSATIDWGDGTALDTTAGSNLSITSVAVTPTASHPCPFNFDVNGTHVYQEETPVAGKYATTITVTDTDNSTLALTPTFSIADAPLKALSNLATQSCTLLTACNTFSNSTMNPAGAFPIASFSDPVQNNQGLPSCDSEGIPAPAGLGEALTSHYSAAINWGDGSFAPSHFDTTPGQVVERSTPNGCVFDVYGTHTYTTLTPAASPAGTPFTVTVKLTDEGGVLPTTTNVADETASTITVTVPDSTPHSLPLPAQVYASFSRYIAATRSNYVVGFNVQEYNHSGTNGLFLGSVNFKDPVNNISIPNCILTKTNTPCHLNVLSFSATAASAKQKAGTVFGSWTFAGVTHYFRTDISINGTAGTFKITTAAPTNPTVPISSSPTWSLVNVERITPS